MYAILRCNNTFVIIHCYSNIYYIHCAIVYWFSFCCCHSFSHFYSAPSSPPPLRGAPDYITDTILEFHSEVHRQMQAARAGVEPTTLLLKAIDSTKAPP